MGEDSRIAWTNDTFNPWWGCQKLSEECVNCYADTFATRLGFKVFGSPDTPRRFFNDEHWFEPNKWMRRARAEGRRRRVFCGSMCDVFEDRYDLIEPRLRLFKLIDDTADWLDWLLLTKRPENAERMLPEHVAAKVWTGTTVGCKKSLPRLDALLRIPSRVHFASCEPLLEDLGDLGPWLQPQGIDWVIVGGESGHKARPLDLAAVRSIRDQCQAHGVSFFYKQGSGLHPESTPELDGRKWVEVPTP